MKLKQLLRRRWALPALCYLVALAVWIVLGAAALAGDIWARSRGSLSEQTLHAADFTLDGLEPLEGRADGEAEMLVTTTGDPQMLLADLGGRTVRTLQVFARYEGDAREMCLYYTTAAGQPYSPDRRVYPAQQADGSYLYTLPRTRIVSLRLDPCSPDENKTVQMTFAPGTITLNAADSLPAAWQYFVPSWYQAFCLVLYPALAAAALSWLRAVWRALRRKTA